MLLTIAKVKYVEVVQIVFCDNLEGLIVTWHYNRFYHLFLS